MTVVLEILIGVGTLGLLLFYVSRTLFIDRDDIDVEEE